MELTIISAGNAGDEAKSEKGFHSVLSMIDIWPFTIMTPLFFLTHRDKKLSIQDGIDQCRTGWIFFLDINEVMVPYACCHIDTSVDATFGPGKDFTSSFFCEASLAKLNLTNLIPSINTFHKSSEPLTERIYNG